MSFVSKDFLQNKWKYELTVFKLTMFELTMFELTVYFKHEMIGKILQKL